MAYRRTPAVRKRLDETRVRIVTAATRLVVEAGYGGCSVAAVAEAAGVGTGTIYGFFPSKGELFAEVFRHRVSREVAAASDAGRQALEQGTIRDSIMASVSTFCSRAMRSPRFAYALMVEPVDAAVGAERLAFRDTFSDLLASAIAIGIANGELVEQDPRVTGAGIIGAISEVLIAPLAHGVAEPEVVAQLLAFVDRAIGHSEGKSVD
ncbi:TetR/AcrR family transcriptional regulator [Antrihabitans sp. YC2-6]|uniref:TetR/AcrR family transcriptional regulator n=1 Tax=Antrihabitans sp. YC2-6 TaxID=2799498 RepID=UPI0018F50F0E|nr:TetR/AcrR family transcriptional regulator [Antrihabitans sp. YC2-6]MBJ8343702.1 TetR/AcrR family transcriptional regulator [Antrihabitans sp. YC2-6]